MSDLMKFMMMIIALAFLAFLNSRTGHASHGELKPGIAIPAHRKLPV